MKNQSSWAPSKYVVSGGRLRGSRDELELGTGSRLIGDLVAASYERHLRTHATGRLLDLGCGKVPLYATYAPHVSEVTCVDWAPGDHVDVACDLSQPLPLDDSRYDTIILSDVLEHISQPEALWREMARVLAPNGKIIMNVPFYYSIHSHPDDYYRYTNFALARFVKINGLELVHLAPIGGIVEVFVDLAAKALAKVGSIGIPASAVAQSAAFAFSRTGPGRRVLRVSARNFPLGYFLVARRPD